MSKSLLMTLSLAAAACSAQAAPTQYDVVEMPAVPLSADDWNYVSGYAIDEKGQVLISVAIDQDSFSNGELCKVDKCRRVQPKGESAYWYDFNSAGALAGVMKRNDVDVPVRRNADGSVETLADDGWARGINKASVVVGTYGGGRGFYFDTEMHDLPHLGFAPTTALDINNDGVIVGVSTLKNGKRRAFSYQNGVMSNLGVLPGGTFSTAQAVNARGVAVGCSTDANQDTVAVKYQGGAVIALGTLGAGWDCASGINKSGVIVGVGKVPNDDQRSRAFVYEGHQMLDLNTLISADSQNKWLLYAAPAVNDAGQIVANAIRRSDANSVALLLTPRP